MNKELQELNEILSEKATPRGRAKSVTPGRMDAIANEEGFPVDGKLSNLVQWTTGDDKRFVPASKTRQVLIPGVYEIQHSSQIGIYFEKIPVKTEGLLRFPQTNSERVINEIEKFWDREDLFREYGLTYKRGLILWGPPGAGKSCTIQLIIKDVIDRDGIVIKFTNPTLFLEGMRIFREIQNATPVIILMEDIDSILDIYNESEVLNILDGIDQVERAVFLATTNYPERLGARIINRPSRFDKRFKIDFPNEESRMLYIKSLVGERNPKDLNIDLKKWVKDTDKFSLAHIKELFVAVVILGDDYSEAIETLQTMKEIRPHSDEDSEKFMGFSFGKT